MTNQELLDIEDIESALLTLRKIVEQGLLKVERLKTALPKQTRKRQPPKVKYTSLILSGGRATKRNIKG